MCKEHYKKHVIKSNNVGHSCCDSIRRNVNKSNVTSESWQSAFNAYQEVTVPNGYYKLRAQAWIREYTVTGTDYPVIYLNDATVPFNTMVMTTASRSDVATYFTSGDNGEYFYTWQSCSFK